jgi:hypothetical protein
MCILAGYNLNADSWIEDYIVNPDFVQRVDFLNDQTDKSEQEISAFLDEQEYFYRRLNKTTNSKTSEMNKKLKIEIYDLLKYYKTHALTLKELTRIAIRKSLLHANTNIKEKIQHALHLPKRLKDYLLLEEFHI